MNDDTPWWWPSLIDESCLSQLREEYPERAGWSDEELLEYFYDGKDLGQVYTQWDNLGDAVAEYEKLAYAFLGLVREAGKTPGDFK